MVPGIRRLISAYFMRRDIAPALPETKDFCRQRLKADGLCLPFTGVPPLAGLKSLREFSRESALCDLLLFLYPFRAPTLWLLLLVASRHSYWPRYRGLALGGLRRVGAKQLAFERCTVKAADDGLHFFRRGGLHKREAFRLLRLVVADHLDGIRYQVFRG